MEPEDRRQRLEEFLQRVDTRLQKIEEISGRGEQEFELNREVQVEVLRRQGEHQIEVMRELDVQRRETSARFNDLGEHMREQTQALMRMNERLGP